MSRASILYATSEPQQLVISRSRPHGSPDGQYLVVHWRESAAVFLSVISMIEDDTSLSGEIIISYADKMKRAGNIQLRVFFIEQQNISIAINALQQLTNGALSVSANEAAAWIMANHRIGVINAEIYRGVIFVENQPES